jgi:xanthine dehydrogenase accessory factor
VLALKPLDAFTALAAVTHDPKIDDFPLQGSA